MVVVVRNKHEGGGYPTTGVAAGAAGQELGNLGSVSSGSFLLVTNVAEAASLYSIKNLEQKKLSVIY